MKHYLLISIDTEEDAWGGYTIKNPPLENIKSIHLIQRIFEKYCAIPTYLINYPVSTDTFSIELFGNLLEQNKCDIGTHCHPWNTPPFVIEEQTEKNSFMCNLPEKSVTDKMAQLHTTITSNFNFTPIVFRAGRWGVGANVINTIRKLGYKIDTSITPFKDWSDYSGPVFNLQTNNAFGLQGMHMQCLSAEHFGHCNKLEDCIIEIPPTIGFLQNNFQLSLKIGKLLKRKPYSTFHILGILDRFRVLNHRTLSPETSSLADMIKLSNVIMKKGHRFLNMTFHSTSLLPGKSPFVKNDRELNLFLDKIEKYLEFLNNENVSCIGMSKAFEVL